MRSLLSATLVLAACGPGTVVSAPVQPAPKPLPAVCVALVRPPGQPAASHSLPLGATDCQPPATSGNGNLAFQADDQWRELHEVISPSGTVLARSEVPSVHVFGKRNGFIVPFAFSVVPFVQSWDSSGTPLVETSFRGMEPVADNPAGGVVGMIDGKIVWLDDQLAIRFEAPAPEQRIDLAVDEAGNTLALFFADSALHGVWYDTAGVPGAPFKLLPPELSPTSQVIGQELRFDRRLGGGFFVAITAGYDRARVPGQWLAQLDPLSTTAAPPPDWLAVRNDRRLRTVHAGTAYALLPDDFDPPGTGCTQSIEVFTPDGESCGILAFPQAVPGSCREEHLDIGIDGTVIERARDPDRTHYDPSEEFPRAPMTCFWQWWPALLR